MVMQISVVALVLLATVPVLFGLQVTDIEMDEDSLKIDENGVSLYLKVDFNASIYYDITGSVKVDLISGNDRISVYNWNGVVDKNGESSIIIDERLSWAAPVLILLLCADDRENTVLKVDARISTLGGMMSAVAKADMNLGNVLGMSTSKLTFTHIGAADVDNCNGISAEIDVDESSVLGELLGNFIGGIDLSDLDDLKDYISLLDMNELMGDLDLAALADLFNAVILLGWDGSPKDINIGGDMWAIEGFDNGGGIITTVIMDDGAGTRVIIHYNNAGDVIGAEMITSDMAIGVTYVGGKARSATVETDDALLTLTFDGSENITKAVMVTGDTILTVEFDAAGDPATASMETNMGGTKITLKYDLVANKISAKLGVDIGGVVLDVGMIFDVDDETVKITIGMNGGANKLITFLNTAAGKAPADPGYIPKEQADMMIQIIKILYGRGAIP